MNNFFSLLIMFYLGFALALIHNESLEGFTFCVDSRGHALKKNVHNTFHSILLNSYFIYMTWEHALFLLTLLQKIIMQIEGWRKGSFCSTSLCNRVERIYLLFSSNRESGHCCLPGYISVIPSNLHRLYR